MTRKSAHRQRLGGLSCVGHDGAVRLSLDAEMSAPSYFVDHKKGEVMHNKLSNGVLIQDTYNRRSTSFGLCCPILKCNETKRGNVMC